LGCRRTVSFLFGLAAGIERSVRLGSLVLGPGSGEGLLQAGLGSGLGVGLAVADGQGGVILGQRLRAVGENVIEPAQVDVRPGERARVFGEFERLLKVLDGVVGAALHQVEAGHDVMSLGVIAVGIVKRRFGKRGGAVEVSLEQLHLGQIKPLKLSRCPGDDLALVGAPRQEGDLLVPVALTLDIHAVDHLGDVFLQADAVLLHLDELSVEVIDQHPSLAHGEIDLPAADRFGLAIVGGHGVGVFAEIDAAGGGFRLCWLRDAGVHGLNLDGLDEALRQQGRDIGLVVKVDGGILHRLQQRNQPLDGGAARVDEGLHLVVKIGVADLVHVDGAERVAGGRDHDNIVVAVDAGVGSRRREHWLKQNQKTAAVVAADRHVQVDVGVQHHAGQRIVDALEEIIVIGAMRDPDDVKMNVLDELAQQRKYVDDLSGIGRQLGLVDGNCKLRRRQEIECQRNVLGKIEGAVGQGMLADVGAEGIAAGAGFGRGGKFGVDLVTNGRAHRAGGGQVGVVAADVERDGDVEERLAGLERDGGAAGLGLGDARGDLSGGLLHRALGGTAAGTGRRLRLFLRLRLRLHGKSKRESHTEQNRATEGLRQLQPRDSGRTAGRRWREIWGNWQRHDKFDAPMEFRAFPLFL